MLKTTRAAAALLLALALQACNDLLPPDYSYSQVRLQVNDLAGAPVTGAKVGLYTGRRGLESAGITDSTGRYVFVDVPFGEYSVAVDVPETYRVPQGGSYFTVVEVGEGMTVDATLTLSAPCCGRIRVRVTDPAGAPLAGVPLEANGRGGASATGVTGADGTFAFENLRGDVYRVTAVPPYALPIGTVNYVDNLYVQQLGDLSADITIPAP